MKSRFMMLAMLLALAAVHKVAMSQTEIPEAIEADLLLPGHEGFTGAHLQPFSAVYDQIVGDEVQSQRTVQLEETRFTDGDGLRLVIAMLGKGGVYDEVRFLRQSLQTRLRLVSALRILHKMEVWHPHKVMGAKMAKDGSDVEPFEFEILGERFSDTVVGLALPALPLSEGYRATFPIFNSDLDAGRNLYQQIEVEGRETITAGNGNEYSTWVVASTFLDLAGNAIMPTAKTWLAAEPPYQIRTEFGFMKLELVEVRCRNN